MKMFCRCNTPVLLGIGIILLTAANAHATPICSAPKDVWGLVGSVTSVQFNQTNPNLALVTGCNHSYPDSFYDTAILDLETGRLLRCFENYHLVALSPDGKKVATLDGGVLKLWNAETGEWMASFRNDNLTWPVLEAGERQLKMTFTPDGTKVLIWGFSVANLFDAATGEWLRTFRGRVPYWMAPPDPDSAVISSDGKTLFFGPYVWNFESGEQIRTLGDGEGRWLYSSDGVYALNDDRSLYNTATGEKIKTFANLQFSLNTVFSSDNKYILDPYDDMLWDLATGLPIALLAEHPNTSCGIFSPDGKRLLTGSADGSLMLWDVQQGDSIKTFPRHAATRGGVIDASFADDKQFSGDKTGASPDPSVTALPVDSPVTPVRKYEGYGDAVNGCYSLAFSPDGKQLLVGSPVGAQLYDVASGEIIRTYGQRKPGPAIVMYVENGKQVQIFRENVTVERWNAETGELLHVLDLQSLEEWKGAWGSNFFSKDGKRAVFNQPADTHSEVNVRDAYTGELVRGFSFDHRVLYAELSSDGTGIIILERIRDNSERYGIWDIDSGALLCSVYFDKGDKVSGGDSAFTPDGKQFIARGKLWDIATGHVVREVPFGTGVWSPDGRQMLNNNVLYDFATGSVLRTFDLKASLYNAAFSPDGTTLATNIYGFSTVKLWDAQGCFGPVAVPYLIGVKKVDAEAMLDALGLTIGNVTTSFSTSVARDTIVNQSPPADTPVDQGTTVDLEVCVGAPRMVPNLAGLSRDAAISRLAGLDLVLGTETERYNDTVAAGCVISQEPASGQMVAVGSTVDIVLSKGPMPQTVLVPNVVDMVRSNAENVLIGGGVTVGLVSEVCNNSVALGLVISQIPVASTQVTSGTAVNLVVSSGPCGTNPTVPNTVGQTQAGADTLISGAGLTSGNVTQQCSDSVALGLVMSQSPEAGAQVIEGTGVSLVVSSGPCGGEGEDHPPTESELRDALDVQFAAIDANHDGAISFAEAQAALPGLTQSVFNAVDADGSGQISSDEADGGDDGGGCGGCSGTKSAFKLKESLGSFFLVGLGLMSLLVLRGRHP